MLDALYVKYFTLHSPRRINDIHKNYAKRVTSFAGNAVPE